MRSLESGSSRRMVFITALLFMGFSGIVAQVLLLRELLIVFSGNELVIGVILANWLIIEAAGSFLLGRYISGTRRKIGAFILVQVLFSLFLPLAIYLTRGLRVFLGVVPGEGLGFLHILYSSFLILLPVALPHGALFTSGCKIYSQFSSSRSQAESAGRVYFYETLGTIVGGLSFAYLMIPHLHSLQIAFIVALLNLASCLSLISPFWTDRIKGTLAGISIVSLLFISYLLFGEGADEIHRSSIDAQWEGQNVIHYQNSIYGNITVTEAEGQYTFFSDGVPVITVPDPDITFVEEFAHIPMLFHPDPREILVLSGGAGGVINEILKHSTVKRVDYAELDPLLLELIRKFPTPITQSELDDPRVEVKNLDARLFIHGATHGYSVIFIGLSTPSDLQVNRMFTEEFFRMAKNRLEDGGILTLTLPGSLTYLSEELKNLNACILNTLRDTYPYVRVIPGEFNLFLASTSPEVSLIKAPLLSQRLDERDLRVELLSGKHIEYRLHDRWVEWFMSFVEGYKGRNNRDFLPVAVFHSLSYWNALFSPSFHKRFKALEGISLGSIAIFVFAFTAAFGVLLWRVRGYSRLCVTFVVINTGFAGMLFDLLIIFTFQTLYGYVFHQVGILITVFMVGTAAGSLLITSFVERLKRHVLLFIRIELGIILFTCLLPVVFLILHSYLERSVVPMVFSLLSFTSGFLLGSQFPLAMKIYLRSSPDVGSAAGLLYGADLLGGWLGGLVGGIVLLPMLGVVKTCITVAMIKLSSFFIVLLLHRRDSLVARNQN